MTHTTEDSNKMISKKIFNRTSLTGGYVIYDFQEDEILQKFEALIEKLDEL